MTKTFPVLTDNGTIHLPVPTTGHHVARIAYKALLAALVFVGAEALVRTNDPQVVWGALMLILPLPGLLYTEYRIRKIDWKKRHKVSRAVLFAAELMIGPASLAGLPDMPALLAAYGFHPSIPQLAFFDIAYMFTVGLGGAIANRVWALHWLGYER